MNITMSEIGYNGRLGNQLFQFAAAYSLSKVSGKELILPMENMAGRTRTHADGNKTVRFSVPDIFPKTNQFVRKILWHRDGPFRRVEEKSFSYDTDVLKFCKQDVPINLHGYFQSPLYFYDRREELLDLFSFKKKMEKPKVGCPLVSLHVRRTDYLNLGDYHTNLGMEYYGKAIRYFTDRLGRCDFLIFSDDIEWCKDNFLGGEFLFSDDVSESDALQKMSLCGHNIIANSTFSWWGAYLNKNKDKQIIAPKNWFGPLNQIKDFSEILSIATKTI